MGKKKLTNEDGKKVERFMWTHQMDDALIDALYNQHVEGNRVNQTFTMLAYDNILKEQREAFNMEMELDKTKIRNRLKTIKEHFGECYDLFKNRTSGFAWSPVTRTFNAEPEVWKELIAVQPSAEKWMTTPVSNYDKLAKIFGKDRANGEGAETAKEKLRRRSNSTTDTPTDTIESVDHMVSQNEATLENYINLDEVDMSSAKNESSSKKKRRLPHGERAKVEEIKTAMKDIASAIREGNAVIEKAHGCVSTGQLHKALEEIGIEPYKRTESYLFLINKPERMMAFFGSPVEYRKETLEYMMFDAQQNF
ncbi:hypothetical protein RHGRI_029951 [Rhododendron griersonianum]|uniref:Myb/SANT-like domain-containing protein n=1 Tax=Rhododendron griersonianum TaxID=479676 RepID=A0AAV6IS58_9ERIC|nr:hypothetical protein RHGRI_029951 [Rhododendron griersonianum]